MEIATWVLAFVTLGLLISIGNGPAKDLTWQIISDSKKDRLWDKGNKEYVGVEENIFLKKIREDDYENNEVWEKEKIKLGYKDMFNRGFTQIISLNFHESPTLDFVLENKEWVFDEKYRARISKKII